MKNTNLILATMLGLGAMVASAQAEVSRVVVAETSNVAAYLKEMDKVRALLKRVGSDASVRVWRARFAGPNAGSLVVTIEYADMATFAADDAKMRADAEYDGLIKGLDAIRTIESDSLYEEL